MSDNKSEIEKKFLVKDSIWEQFVYDSKTIYQGYFLDKDKERKRIRLVKEDEKAIIAYKEDKGLINGFLERIEKENETDYTDGLLLLIKCKKVLVKRRNYIKFNDLIIEVDQFLNLSFPLTMAEVEITKEQTKNAQDLKFPEWFDKDVTLSKKYRNATLVKFAQDSDFYLKQLISKNNKPKI